MAGRFIKLYDKILNWEWYSDINTFRLFVHLLLKANYKDLKFEGKKILRGQLVTSLVKLSSQTGLSVRQVRVSLDKLKLTGEVTSTAFSKYRIITIVRYDEYQANDKQDDKQMTTKVSGKWQADDKQMTSKRQADDKQMTTSIDNIEYIEQVEQIENIESKKTARRFTPPTKEEIFDFCLEEHLSIDVDYLYDYYSSKGWKIGSSSMKDWKAAVRNWARRDKKNPAQSSVPVPAKTVTAQQYSQRDYSGEQEAAIKRMLAAAGWGDAT